MMNCFISNLLKIAPIYQVFQLLLLFFGFRLSVLFAIVAEVSSVAKISPVASFPSVSQVSVFSPVASFPSFSQVSVFSPVTSFPSFSQVSVFSPVALFPSVFQVSQVSKFAIPPSSPQYPPLLSGYLPLN